LTRQPNRDLIAPWGLAPTPALPKILRVELPDGWLGHRHGSTDTSAAPESVRSRAVEAVKLHAELLDGLIIPIRIPRPSILQGLPLSRRARALAQLVVSLESPDPPAAGREEASPALSLVSLIALAGDLRPVLELASVLEAYDQATPMTEPDDATDPFDGLRDALAWAGDPDPSHRTLGDLLSVPLNEWPAPALKGWLRFTSLPLDTFGPRGQQLADTIRATLERLDSCDRAAIVAGALEPRSHYSPPIDPRLEARVATMLDGPDLARLRSRAQDLAAQLGAAVPMNSPELATALRNATEDLHPAGPEMQVARSFLLWMAGPFTRVDGWLLVDPTIDELTTSMLSERLEEVTVVSREAAADLLRSIGILPVFADRWLSRITIADPDPLGWRFDTSRRRAPSMPLDLATSPRCYHVEGRWSLRIPVGPEALGPRSTVVPAPFAALVGGRPGDNVVVPASVAALILRWDRSAPTQPRLDSLRELVNRVAACDGDHLVLRCGASSIEPLVLRSRELETLPTDCHRLCRLVGLDPVEAEDPREALRAVGRAIDLDHTDHKVDSWDLRLALVARGEADLASLVPPTPASSTSPTEPDQP